MEAQTSATNGNSVDINTCSVLLTVRGFDLYSFWRPCIFVRERSGREMNSIPRLVTNDATFRRERALVVYSGCPKGLDENGLKKPFLIVVVQGIQAVAMFTIDTIILLYYCTVVVLCIRAWGRKRVLLLEAHTTQQ